MNNSNAFVRRPVAQAISLVLGTSLLTPVLAQENDSAEQMGEIVVTGIRASLESSMNVKRGGQGVVDGIVAEDIGKFPDTNLAESLQRISGVSINRTASGEGQQITIRGVGPDFNLVLLNGRQMPASNLGPGGGGTTNSRAYDFSNLASEAVSGIEVFKTARAATPTGGIGATVNIKTARPLDHPGLVANLGVKGVYDPSATNLPSNYSGDDITPELSAIFSNTFADDKFGVGLSASYQKRDSGFSQAAVANGWKTLSGANTTDGARLPRPGDPNYAAYTITNEPGLTDVYGRPQNFGLSVNGVQRERINGQVVLQFAPTDALTTTLDYTYAQNKVQTHRSELSVWFNWGPGTSSWTAGPVVGPEIYSENMVGSDLSMGGMSLATKNENKSVGFNVDWRVSDRLKFGLDIHDSVAESSPDSPYGSAGVLGVAGFVRGTTTVDFSNDFPILNVVLPAGRTQVDPSDAVVTGSVFQNSFNRSEVQQAQASGSFEFTEHSGLEFGLSATKVENRTAAAVAQQNNWGGLGSPADYSDDIWFGDDMGGYFDLMSGHNDSRFTDHFLVFDFNRLRERAAEVLGDEAMFRAPDQYTSDLRSTEKSKSAYLQYSQTFESKMPLHVAAGVRYEKTEVESASLVRIGQTISWDSANEFNIGFAQNQAFDSGTGEYDYVLPSLDFKLDLRENLVARASYSQTIGRPGWNDIQGGANLAGQLRFDGGTGSSGDPGLKPLESDNYDLSVEWYYGDASYVSLGYFKKKISNFISNVITQETPFNMHTPAGGAYWNEAIAAGCAVGDRPCIRNFIFDNHDGDPGVTMTGVAGNGDRQGTIVGQASDPIATFLMTRPANQRSDELDGWELNVQHMFGDSGFGVAANYTKVDSGLKFNDTDLTSPQYPMLGLADSYNLVAFYDKFGWQVRAAYNWRDQFLAFVGDGQGVNPGYTDEYGQLDLNVTYALNEHLSVFGEGINLTNETQRIHGRNDNQLLFATQTGARYMFGARYKF
ncbi:MAG TPA: TonB-dependent receptor [Steroidobacteraceae bacterium]|nr:TonB-dependent receptor [Steroidobacteraceae bacterium]